MSNLTESSENKMPHKTTKIPGLIVGHAKLYNHVSNPLTYAKIGVSYARHKGAVLPGSKYIGPWNPLPPSQDAVEHSKRWRPKNALDASALEHDRAYDGYLKRGVRATKLYTGYSHADRVLLNKSKEHLSTPHGLAVFYGMEAKRLGAHIGLTKKID
jgi:hypothetical protein